MTPYKGYSPKITETDNTPTHPLYGEAVGPAGLIVTFAGKDMADAQRAFEDSIDDLLAWCVEDGVDPAQPEADQ